MTKDPDKTGSTTNSIAPCHLGLFSFQRLESTYPIQDFNERVFVGVGCAGNPQAGKHSGTSKFVRQTELLCQV